MASLVVITGTDTGVGKTWVARALGGALTRAGRRVVAIKPVETGCSAESLNVEDGALLSQATGQAAPREALFRFAEPLAPALAAERAGTPIDFDEMVIRIEQYAESAELALVEGVGGLLSPITWEWNVVDLARALNAPALLVGCDRLGAINHTLLALSALELGGVPLAGVVLTAPAVPDPSTGTNAAAVARLAGFERIRMAPHLPDPDAATGWARELGDWLLPA